MPKDEQAATGNGATQGARIGGQVGTAVGSAVGMAVEGAVQRAGETATAVAGGYEVVRERAAAADTGAMVKQLGEVLEGVIEDGRGRAAVVLGRRTPPRRRGWAWATGAAVAGAAAGAAVAFAVRRLVGQDAPEAQEPEHLRAVVDPAPVVVDTSAAAPASVDPLDPPVGS